MRPFVCPYCSKSHTQGDNLKIHIRKAHPECAVPSVQEMRDMLVRAYHAPALYSALTDSAPASDGLGLEPPMVTLDGDND